MALIVMPLTASYHIEGGSPASNTATKLGSAQWPLAEVREKSGPGVFYGSTSKALYIEAASGVPLSKLVRLTLFGSFRPGSTIDQTRTRFGEPVQTRSERGDVTLVYDTPAARIEVKDDLSGSGCGTYHRRTVYAYPKQSAEGCSAKASDLFDSSVNGRIPDMGSIEIGMAEAGGGDRVWALVKDKCVQSLNWWTPSSQP